MAKQRKTTKGQREQEAEGTGPVPELVRLLPAERARRLLKHHCVIVEWPMWGTPDGFYMSYAVRLDGVFYGRDGKIVRTDTREEAKREAAKFRKSLRVLAT